MKNIADFPDLDTDGKPNKISIEHFKNGLDPYQYLYGNYCVKVGDSFKMVEKIPLLAYIFEISYSIRGINGIMDGYEELCDFAKNALLRGHIPQKELIDMAFNSLVFKTLDLIEFMVQHQLVDINARHYGYTFLMHQNDKKNILRLVELGCDVTARMNDPTSPDYGKSAYEIALITQKKGWISSLAPYVLDEVKDNHLQRQNSFKSQNIKQQFKLFSNAVKEKNKALIDEIIQHPQDYRGLMDYRDAYGNNLIDIAIKQRDSETVERLLVLESYQSCKNSVNKYHQCYTTKAISLEHYAIAKILYRHGFKNDEILIPHIKLPYYESDDILRLLIDDSFKPSLDERIYKSCLYKIEEDNIGDIKDFLARNDYFFSLENLIERKGTYRVLCAGHSYQINASILKILSYVISKSDDSEQYLQKIIGKIGLNPQNIALKLAPHLMAYMPEKKSELPYLLGYYKKSDWLIKINHEKLQCIINQEIYSPEVKKIKI